MNRAAQTKLASPSLDTIASKEIAAWAKPKPQRGTPADLSRNANGRGRRVAPTGSEGDRLSAETEFMRAMQAYKQRSGLMFPTWSEVLEVLQSLGYQKGA